MTVVSFREYERIRVVPTLSALDERALSVNELQILEQLGKRMDIPIIEHLSHSWIRPRQYVGAIQLPTRMLEFLPKVESDAADKESLPLVRHNLLKMLLVAYDLDGASTGKAALAEHSGGWLDLMIRLFAGAMAEQIRRGLVKLYREAEEDLPAVRGRILIDEQLRRNLVHRERTACAFDEFDENHALNQLFRAALMRMLRVAGTHATQQAIRELLPAFEAVADVQPSLAWLDRVGLDRMSERYDVCLQLAKLFLQGATTDLYAGAQDSFALLFDMNEVFERYIGKVMRRALRPEGNEVLLQHAKYHLVRDVRENRRLFQLRPDMVVMAKGASRCIVDTKWKRLQAAERKLGVAQPDLYQMLAYSERYGCEAVLLLYPWTDSGGKQPGVGAQFVFEGKTTRVTIGEISLQDLNTVPAQLQTLMSMAAPCTAGL